MTRLVFTLTLEAPALVGEIGTDPNAVSSATRVRGAMILGALATRWLAKNQGIGDPAVHPEFRRLFLGGCVFLDANPAVGSDLDKPTRLIPRPRSIMQDKRTPKSDLVDLSQSPDERRHADRQWVSPSAAPDYVQWTPDARNRTVLRGRDPAVVATMHHVRDRAMGRPVAGDIFFYDALQAGEVFVGAIEGTEDDICTLRGLLDSGPLLLGRSRTARYGGVAKVGYPKYVDPRVWSEATALSEDDYDPHATGKCLLTVTVLSECIVRDPETGELTPRAFKRSLVEALEESGVAEPGDPLIEESAYVTVGRSHGHVNAWGMHRPTTSTIASGSVYVYETDVAVVPGTILRVGERTHEGYGRVILNLQGGIEETRVDLSSNTASIPVAITASTSPSGAGATAPVLWALQRLTDAWYNDRLSEIVRRAVDDRRFRPPAAAATAALRAAVARSAWPNNLDERKSLEQAGLGRKAIDDLSATRLPELGALLSTLSALLRPKGGEKLKELAEKLTDRRPDLLDAIPSDPLARQFADQILQAMRRKAQEGN